MPKRIYLIRHTESQNNVVHRKLRNATGSVEKIKLAASLAYLGFDSDCSPDGYVMLDAQKQILEESQFLSENQIQLILHSSLVRAKTTCKLLFAGFASCPPILEKPGIHEKAGYEYLDASHLEARASAFKKYLLHERREESICVVAHSGFFQVLLDRPDPISNCEVLVCTLLDHGEFDKSSLRVLFPGGKALLPHSTQASDDQDE